MAKRRFSMLLKAHNQVIRVGSNNKVIRVGAVTSMVLGLHKLVFPVGRK
jgi:hypothetical protein